jgi:hypothetical protein
MTTYVCVLDILSSISVLYSYVNTYFYLDFKPIDVHMSTPVGIFLKIFILY